MGSVDEAGVVVVLGRVVVEVCGRVDVIDSVVVVVCGKVVVVDSLIVDEPPEEVAWSSAANSGGTPADGGLLAGVTC